MSQIIRTFAAENALHTHLDGYIMKRVFKWIAIVLLSPVLLFVVLVALLYVPPIQNWVVQQVASMASEETGMDISVEHVNLSFPLDLKAEGVRVVRDGDTIADIRSTTVDVQLWPLVKGNIVLNELRLDDARLNTLDFIPDVRLKGTIGTLSLSSPGIDAAAMKMELRQPRLSHSDLTVYMSDTAAVDTTTTGWHIRFDRFDFEQTRLRIVMDSAARFDAPAAVSAASPVDPPTRIDTYLHEASLREGDLHLGLARFMFGSVEWHEGRLGYGDDVALSDVELHLDSLFSYKGELRVGIAQASMKEEKTGVALHQLQGGIAMNGDDISLRRLNMEGTATWQEQPVTLRASVDGDTRQMDIERISISMPTMAHAELSGQVNNVMDMERLSGQLALDAQVYQTLKGDGMQLPAGTQLRADIRLPEGEQRTLADVLLRNGSGSATVDATLHGTLADLADHPETTTYDVRLSSRNLNLSHFMPGAGMGQLSADATLHGSGGLPLSDSGSRLQADVQLHRLGYDQWLIDSVQATATISGDHVLLHANSHNDLLRGTIDMDALVSERGVKGEVSTALTHADMQALGMTDMPTVMGLDGDFTIESDLRRHHYLSALVDNIYIRDTVDTYHPEKLGVLLKAEADTTVVRLQSGDLVVKADLQGGYEELLPRLTTLADTVTAQIDSRTIDQQALKRLLPTGRLMVSSKRDNPIAKIITAQTGITIGMLHADLTTSPQTGLNGQMDLHGLNTGSMLLDSIRLSLVEKDHGLTFNGFVANAPRNPAGTFRILFDGLLQQHGASLGARYFDEQGRMNIRLGTKAEMVSLPSPDGDRTGIRFQLIPKRPTLGYKEFALNSDNYLLLRHDLKLEANVDLLADDGTHIMVYSEELPETLLQDLTVSVNSLDLGELTSGIAMLPAISGKLTGDYHLMMDRDHNISVASDMGVQQMVYEGSPIGDLGTELVYLLREDGTHVVDGTLMLDNEPIGVLQGSYLDGKRLDATLELTAMPLSILNGFMPDQLIGFEGTADGALSVSGPLSQMDMDGSMRFTNGYLVSNPYGMRMRFGDQPLQMQDSRLIMDGFTLYAMGDDQQQSPLTINGSVDLYGTGTDDVNLRLTARNFQLVNAKQKKESVAYGKMFVNFFARLTGNLDRLNMRGRLDVLGSTDLNYVLLDSPLSTDSEMDDLVRFTDFSDTTQTVVVRPESDALDLDVQLSIDEGTHVRCALNATQSNYIDLMGGGDLRLRMGGDGMNLTGRYTISSGTMKYSLPIIPLKTFTLAQGSYVEFTGQPDNPTLNITATERRRAAVGNAEGEGTRNVLFDCGVVITQTLENMGLAFTISAPEDMQLQGELTAMGEEQRGKLAVTMLTTGMYLADGNTGAFSMNTALSSFLQSEINNITAGALKTIDLQVGLDNTTTATGETHTDYSFSFAKRFWNNRLSVQLGGKVSTGAEMEGQQQSFFDNVTMEYRLSPTGNQYVKLFYKQNVYDWLEGYTGEYGAGYLWKRKLDRLTDIFRKKPTPNPSPTPDPSPREGRSDSHFPQVLRSDSIKNDSIQ